LRIGGFVYYPLYIKQTVNRPLKNSGEKKNKSLYIPVRAESAKKLRRRVRKL